jgi:flagellar motor switch protein FliN/FliY
MTPNQNAGKAEESFVGGFSSAFAKVLSRDTGSPWLIAAVPDPELTPDGSDPVRTRLELDGSLRGEALLEIHRASAAILASQLLRQPAGEFGAEQAEALLKVLDAAVIEFCAEAAQENGVFTIAASSVSEPAPQGARRQQFTIADNDSNRVSVLMYLTPPLIEALSVHSKAAGNTGVIGRAMRVAPGKAIPEQVNLNLVMDVELNVTLRFGQRQLTLREVLELTSGSVVELDRQVEEPVELLLDSKVIARGEAVVIDGNYGLRVTEVCQAIF